MFVNKFKNEKLKSLSQIELSYHDMLKEIIEKSPKYNNLADFHRKIIDREYKEVTNV